MALQVPDEYYLYMAKALDDLRDGYQMTRGSKPFTGAQWAFVTDVYNAVLNLQKAFQAVVEANDDPALPPQAAPGVGHIG